MATTIYGVSDDLIEVDGDVRGEVSFYGHSGKDSCLLTCSDGTVLSARYNELGIWKLEVLREGALFNLIVICNDPEATVYSDQVHFMDGVKWVLASTEWEKVQ